MRVYLLLEIDRETTTRPIDVWKATRLNADWHLRRHSRNSGGRQVGIAW